MVTSLEAAEHNLRGFIHSRSCQGNVGLETLQRRADQNSIVHWRADFDITLSCETACKPKYLRAVSLHWEITERSRVGSFVDVDLPKTVCSAPLSMA
ncbi:MAG: hypothetical protein K0R61_1768 [Microvirga sp.]|jgi:hypothetical protein|nr:hypothetical protein [Microvirga sp.]MDF2971318.1 hypothetical protein [Microvirga sp.]